MMPLALRCRSGARTLVLLSLGAGGLTACERPVDPIAPSAPTPGIQPYVTGDAARDIGSGGRFISAGAAPGIPDQPIISAERAGELATAFARTWGRFYRDDWAKERGAHIDPGGLSADPRIYYAETSYGEVPDGFHPAFRRAFGAWYLVTLTQGGNPALVVAVSAHNTDMKIDGHGNLVQPSLSGNDFHAWGVAARDGAPGLRPLTPEQAVAAVGRRTGARIHRTPDLLLREIGQHPANALWRLHLDRGVRVRAAGREREARALYAGPGGRYFVPRDTQPGSHRGTGIRYDASGQRIGPAPLEVPVKPGGAVEFEEVTVDAPEA